MSCIQDWLLSIDLQSILRFFDVWMLFKIMYVSLLFMYALLWSNIYGDLEVN